jgi:hypothetical protein
MKWAYGITTVPSRRADLLPRTIASLRSAGFEEPRLFVDGDGDALSWEREFGCPVTCRQPKVLAFGNWMLALWELYLREPAADRFALFQDDFITYRNLRQYLEACPYPERGYLNLYTFPQNQALAPKDGSIGFYPTRNNGLGAVALVFDLQMVSAMLTHQHLVDRPLDFRVGHRRIDGGVVETAKKLGVCEYVHHPSLVLHTGVASTIDKTKAGTRNSDSFPIYYWPESNKAPSFLGEGYDALDLLKERRIPMEQGAGNTQRLSGAVRSGAGRAAYDGFPEPRKSELIARWETELAALRSAIQGDEERMAQAATATQKRHFMKLISNYRHRLQRMEANNPPFGL